MQVIGLPEKHAAWGSNNCAVDGWQLQQFMSEERRLRRLHDPVNTRKCALSIFTTVPKGLSIHLIMPKIRRANWNYSVWVSVQQRAVY
eukprot:scaffold489678_cov18-Prasinocladus_malaysianus.AAC.1